MAKYNINYACGHSDTIALFGKQNDRYRKIEWLEREGKCLACCAAEVAKNRDAQRAVERADAQAFAARNALPALEGSEKQIAWAETIRRDMLKSFTTLTLTDDMLTQVREMGAKKGFSDERIEAIVGAIRALYDEIAVVAAETSAKWFIDNRNNAKLYTLRAEFSKLC